MTRPCFSREEMKKRLASLKSSDGVRIAKVQSTMDAIDSGLYEDGEKLGIAIDRLIADLERRMLD